jgi:acyl carrier protein
MTAGHTHTDRKGTPMRHDEALTGIADVLGAVANIPAADVTPEAKFVEDLGIDSLTRVDVVVAVEDRFGQVIPDDDWARFTTVGDAVTHLMAPASARGGIR